MTETSSRVALEEFLRQMGEWEKKYSRLDEELEDDYEPWKQAHKESDAVRQQILSRWCDPVLLTPEMLLGGCLQTPHRYDPTRDEVRVVSESKESAEYEYEQRVGLRSVFRFTLRKSQAGWLFVRAQLRAESSRGVVWESLLF